MATSYSHSLANIPPPKYFSFNNPFVAYSFDLNYLFRDWISMFGILSLIELLSNL